MGAHVNIFEALRDRFSPPEWAYFREVRNGTGFSRKTTRIADALAFSLYPSRGLELHGIEVKCSRPDWIRERKDPEKAEEIGRFCHRWWLATEFGVIKDVSEIPPAWGWLELKEGEIRQKKEASKRVAEPLDLPMIASILRKASSPEALEELVQHRFLKSMVAERERHSKDLERMRQSMEAYREDAAKLQRLEYQLGNIGRILRLDLLKYPLPVEVSERLEVLGRTDLNAAKAEIANAAKVLKRAAGYARWAIRKARRSTGP